MQSEGYEWQTSYKDIKFKCRTKFNESDIWDSSFGEFSFEEFLKNDFIKFYLQIFKWSKDVPDCYYLDATFMKSSSPCNFMQSITDLFESVKSKAATQFDVEIINTITIIEETLPNRG
jgi:hypothetical protein